MRNLEIEKRAGLFCYSAYVNGVYKIHVSDRILSFKELAEAMSY